MSSISSTSSATDPYQATNLSAFVQFVNDFNAIGNALQSGSISSAQSALSAFQQDLPGSGSQTSTSQPFGNNTKANTDFQSLSSALQSGDLSAAQKAFASLQNDLQGGGTGKTHRHHHHHGSGTSDTNQTTNSTTTTGTSSALDSDEDALLNVTA